MVLPETDEEETYEPLRLEQLCKKAVCSMELSYLLQRVNSWGGKLNYKFDTLLNVLLHFDFLLDTIDGKIKRGLQPRLGDFSARNQQTAFLDARALMYASQFYFKTADQLTTEVATYNRDEFAEHLKAIVTHDNGGARKKNWKNLEFVTTIFRETPCMNYIKNYRLESMNVVPQKKERRAREKIVHTELKMAKTILKTKSDVKDVSEQVLLLKEKIKDKFDERMKNPISLIKLVLDRKSYSHTVENLFHLSFLVRDFVVMITEDKDGLPVVMPVSDAKLSNSNIQMQRRQAVLSLKLSTWEEALNVKRRFQYLKRVLNRIPVPEVCGAIDYDDDADDEDDEKIEKLTDDTDTDNNVSSIQEKINGKDDSDFELSHDDSDDEN